MQTAHVHEEAEDSNSFYSVSNFMPLNKREAPQKRAFVTVKSQDKIDSIGFQLVE